MKTMGVMVMVASLTFLGCDKEVSVQFHEAKNDTARMQAKQLAEQAYAQWSLNSRRSCPSSVDDLLKFTNSKDGHDPWGQPFRMLCGETAPAGARGGFGIVSDGPDKKPDTGDDIKSWK